MKKPPTGDPAHDVLKYERQPLDAIFRPETVAVIGATEKAGSVGRTILWNLISNPFGGTVFPVNPKRPSVLGIKAYPSLAAVPDRVDLAVIVTPAPTVPGPDGRVRRGRGPRGDHHLRRLQGDRGRGRRAGTPGPGAGPARPDARHRPELPRRDEPADRPERHLRRRHGPARQRRLPQPERRPLHRRARLEPHEQRRLQRLRLGRLDARRRLGRPDRPPRRRPPHHAASSSTWSRSATRGRSSRRRARWR